MSQTTQKANIIKTINAFATAKASGDPMLYEMMIKVLDIQLATLPDNWTAEPEKPKEDVAPECNAS